MSRSERPTPPPCLWLLGLLLLVPAWALAGPPAPPTPGEVPGQINFQGLLLDSGGQPVNGMVDLDFRLYEVATGGSWFWTESHTNVEALDGVYQVALGSITPLDAEALVRGSIYLEVVVESETLAPRQRLLAVAYALRARRADSADAVLSSTDQVPAGNVPTPLAELAAHTSITIGADGYPVVSYGGASDTLRLLKCGDPSCSDQTVNVLDAGPGSVEATSISIGTDGNPVIAHIKNAAKIAFCSDAACAVTPTIATFAESADEWGISVTIGLDGLPIVAFKTGGDLVVAKCLDSSCSTTTETRYSNSEAQESPSIAMGFDGRAYVASANTATGLSLARCGQPACTTAAFTALDASPGFEPWHYPSLAIGDDGLPVVSYLARKTSTDEYYLRVARCNDPACGSNSISPLSGDGLASAGSLFIAGRATSMTIGHDGNPVTAFLSAGAEADLVVVRCGDASCSAATITTTLADGAQPGENLGYHHAMTLGPDGRPVLSYQDLTSGLLKVLHCGNAFCVPNWTRR